MSFTLNSQKHESMFMEEGSSKVFDNRNLSPTGIFRSKNGTLFKYSLSELANIKNNSRIKNMQNNDHMSPQRAASILGLSTTLIQGMVDRNELKGWKTPGGHRRISTESIEAYLGMARNGDLNKFRHGRSMHVMVVSESDNFREDFIESSFPFTLSFQKTIDKAFMEMLKMNLFILIAEINRPPEVFKSLLDVMLEINSSGSCTSITLITDAPKELIPKNSRIQFSQGPLTSDWLNIFLKGAKATSETLRGKIHE